jgi:uncharacterized protein YciI
MGRAGLCALALAALAPLAGCQHGPNGPDGPNGQQSRHGAPQGQPVTAAPAAGFDAALAKRLGADAYGMHSYTLVILKTGPAPAPKGEAAKRIFDGHFANMKRLAAEGKLVLAGPLDGKDGWRGLFVLATQDPAQAQRWIADDPVIREGVMVADMHRYYGSAALKLVNDWHGRIAEQPM